MDWNRQRPCKRWEKAATITNLIEIKAKVNLDPNPQSVLKKKISKRLANQKKTTEMQLMQKGIAFEKDGFFYFSMGPEIEL